MLYRPAKGAFIGSTNGVNRSTKRTETVNAINNLALITATSDGPVPRHSPLLDSANAMGTREGGFASGLPGYRKFECEEDRAELAKMWKIPVEQIPTKRGLAYLDII